MHRSYRFKFIFRVFLLAYVDILEIPTGATSVVISEDTASGNYLGMDRGSIMLCVSRQNIVKTQYFSSRP